MELSVADVARLLKVNEQQVDDWIRHDRLPGYTVQDVLRFNRDEVLEWAATHHVKVSLASGGESLPSGGIVQALERGGVFFQVPGDTREAVLHEVAQRLPLPPGSDRELFEHMLVAREIANPTGIGDGIAIPHVNTPLIIPGGRSSISLLFLNHPVQWYAGDRQPVFCLFVLISPTVSEHLSRLASLANLLQIKEFIALLQKRPAIDELLTKLRGWERPEPVAGKEQP
ncbi:MAG TPA: PTS sugar transporter subunit IIA [Candidatus Ozemobacteraceae bacterium]|nr:PTS sugar transporter subunit IIA [Candidatus Ozemobacteraceae bacterium]